MRPVLVLGDQLSPDVAALRAADPAHDVVLMAEVAEEATYVRHHKKKLAFVFAAELRDAGWTVDYVKLDDPANTGSLVGELARARARHGAERAVVTAPGEWRLLDAFAAVEALDVLEDDRFVCARDEFAVWAEGRKQLRMEFFYREMRRKTGLLMDGDAPAGGRWNFDAENRKPPKAGLTVPGPARFPPDRVTQEVLDLVADRFADNFGTLDPLTVCRRVEDAWRAGDVPLNAAEGFIRQIVGWREYVRGLYWLKMPGYVDADFFGHDRPLPDFYWTAETEMACVRACVEQTRDEAYAHHIQRLMVTGNFAMLAGIDPKAVHEGYLAVYADAYEWVEAPNTLGMSQFADGGLLASKPYAASGNYINKISDYCGGRRYKVAQKTGPDACPFNVLYWDFLARHRDKLGSNPRLGPVYRTWDRMDAARQATVRADAARFLAGLDAA